MRRTVVKVVVGDGRAGRFGTGVFVTPAAVLSARHVLRPDGDAAEVADVFLEGPHWFGKWQVDEIAAAEAAHVDLAVAKIHAPKAVDESNVAVLAGSRTTLNVGDEVDAYGFSSVDRDLQVERLRIVSVDGRSGAYVCNKAVAKGFSGGPVFVGDLLVGILFARHTDHGQCYFHGGHALHALARTLGVPANVPEGASPLRAYPLGPAVSGGVVEARLHRIIDAYIRQFPSTRAPEAIARANGARMASGPQSDPRKALIEVAALPDPRFDSYSFWWEAFRVAGLKSPRMLAALLQVAEEASLSKDEADERRAFLRDLVRWGT